jgi:hypothetical protein
LIYSLNEKNIIIRSVAKHASILIRYGIYTSGENLSPIPIYGGNGNGTGMGMGLKFLKMGLSGTELLGMIEVFK